MMKNTHIREKEKDLNICYYLFNKLRKFVKIKRKEKFTKFN